MQGLIPNLTQSSWPNPHSQAHGVSSNTSLPLYWPAPNPTPVAQYMQPPMLTVTSPQAGSHVPMQPMIMGIPSGYQTQPVPSNTGSDMMNLITQLADKLHGKHDPPAPAPVQPPPANTTAETGPIARVLQALSGIGGRANKHHRGEDSDEEANHRRRKKDQEVKQTSEMQTMMQNQQQLMTALTQHIMKNSGPPSATTAHEPVATPERMLHTGRSIPSGSPNTSQNSPLTPNAAVPEQVTPDVQGSFYRTFAIKGQPTLTTMSTIAFVATVAKTMSLTEWQTLHETYLAPPTPATKAMCIRQLLAYAYAEGA